MVQALSTRGRRMVFVALLNLVYFVMILLISTSRKSEWSLGLQKSLCGRRVGSVTSLNMAEGRTCNHSSTDKENRDSLSVLSGVADKTKTWESGDVKLVEQVTHVPVSIASISDILTISTPTQDSLKEGQRREGAEYITQKTRGQVDDRGGRHERDITTPTSTSQDTNKYQDIKPSINYPVYIAESSAKQDVSPSSSRPSMLLSPVSATPVRLSPSLPSIASPPPVPSLLPDTKTDPSVAQTKVETVIRTRRGEDNELLPLFKSLVVSDDASRFLPSEVSNPDVIGTSESPANAQPSPGQGHLRLDITINVTGITLAVDGVQVYSDLNRTMVWGSKHARLHAGLHLLSLHPLTGQVTAANSFITWQATGDAMFLKALRDTQDSRLLLVAGAPDFTTFLGEEATEILERMGSIFAERLAYRDAWCLLLHKGRGVLHEVLVTSRPGHNYNVHHVSPLITSVTVPSVPDQRCGWHATPGMEEQAAFCHTYDGYGAFCSCHEPPWSPRPASPVSYAAREVIPVAVVTAKRLPRVVHQLGQLWASPGGLHTPVTIFVDGHSPEARSLAALLKVPLVEHHNPATPGTPARINEHLKHVVTQAFRRHPQVDKVIVLEDDLDLAPDFIPFFQQTASLLEEDSTLFCVNAYNYNAYDNTARDATRLYRVHGLPAYGWMVRRHVAEEMVRHWAPIKEGVDWDLWLRNNVMGSRDVLVPEVPRTKHVGSGGAHVTGFEQALYHGLRPLNALPNVNLDLLEARYQPYVKTHFTAIAEAQVVRIVDHPCKVMPLPTHQVNHTFVVYIDVQRNDTSDAYYVIARCLGLNDRNAHENLQVMYTYNYFGNQLYIVGCPVSPFCLAEDEKNVYTPSPEDRLYAENHPYRKPGLEKHIAIRIPPLNLMDLVNLSNLIHYYVTY